MGNKNICGNVENELRVPLNAISPDYDISEENTFKTVKRQYLKYPQKFPYILTQMNEKNIKFVDEYFNCLAKEETVVGDEFYACHNVIQITWKRADELCKVNPLKVTDRIKNQCGNRVSSLHKILYWIMEQPKLVKQIFKFEQLAKEGLALVYLPYYGSQNHPIEIVIDNYLPTHNGSYVGSIPNNSTVGMLLLEKALSKLMGSYQNLRVKSGREIFQIVVGIPLIFQNSGINDDQVSILSKFYNPLYKISSIQQELESKRPQYIKINVVKSTNISISIWQIDESEKMNEFTKYSEIIMQLIRKEKGSFSRVGYASKLYENKTILRATSPDEENLKTTSRQFFTLEEGDYYLHIFSESEKNSVLANIIVYSQNEVSLLFRKQNPQLNEIKRAMIQSVFSQRSSKAVKLEQFIQCANVKSKFIWDGYRGILFLNATNKPLKNSIKIQILPEYRKKIRFEESGEFEMQVEVTSESKVVSFIKFSNIDIGRFYRITSMANK